MKKPLVIILMFIGIFLAPCYVLARGVYTYDILPGQTKPIVGVMLPYTIKDGETLLDVAKNLRFGYSEVVNANPEIDPWIPPGGTEIILPTAYILPEVIDEGIVINLPEMRLYYFFKAGSFRMVRIFPIGIGREGFDSPPGNYKITAKVKDPVWRVPESARKENPKMPRFVPPGPENPLGGYWLQLSIKGYGIHGTNKPYGIGRRVSRGCIRMYQEDIKLLFNSVKIGTKVVILNSPIKVTLKSGNVFLEVHKNINGDTNGLLKAAITIIEKKGLLHLVDIDLLKQVVEDAKGLPVAITKIH